MPKTVAVFLLLLLLSPLTALSSSFRTTDYECSHIDPKRDGIKCAVKNMGESYGETLQIMILIRYNSPKEMQDRVKYMLGTTIHNFLAEGGTWIKIRRVSKKGFEEERTCSRIKGTTRENCGDWLPVSN